jgi:hypothetical protein
MDKQRKPLSTKKPPIPLNDHKVIEDWIGESDYASDLTLILIN